MVHFVPCQEGRLLQNKYARLFIDHVFKLHGLLEIMISGHESQVFKANSGMELFSHLGTDLRFSMAFYPETDGLLDVTNSVTKEFLYALMWRGCLIRGFSSCPLAEFARHQ